jgi:hypothetical protein
MMCRPIRAGPRSTSGVPTFVFRIKLVGPCWWPTASGIKIYDAAADPFDALREFRTCCRELRRCASLGTPCRADPEIAAS